MKLRKYNILESELSSRAYEAGNLYFCTDSANIYYDSTLEEKRIHINNSMIALETEADRENLLNPILYKIYFIKETNRSYIYIGAEWVRVGISSWNDLEDKPFDTIRTETVVLDEMTFYGGTSGIQISIEEEFENVEHTVIFDGVEYKCTPNITDGDSVLGDSGYWYRLTDDYPFGISYIHKQLYTSDGITHTIKVVKNVSETVKQIEDKYIPENIARIDDLMQSDYDQNDSSSLDHIKNRPFYKETREITWDGDTTGKIRVDSGFDDINYYKIADIPEDIDFNSIKEGIGKIKTTDGSTVTASKEDFKFSLYTNVYVACSSTGIFYSINGKEWIPSTVSSNITEIKNVNNMLFAYNSSTTNNTNIGLLYSYNGIDWNKTSINANTISGITYANGLYVAAVLNNYGLYYSTDGINYTQSNITNISMYSVIYDNNLWVAGSSGSGIYYSTDGMTWTQSNIPNTNSFYSIYYANGIWVAGSYNNKGLWYSTDGMTWTQSNITSNGFKLISYNNNLWVTVSYTGGGIGILYSTDGMTWTQSNITGTNFSALLYNNEKNIWVAGTGNDKTGIYYSTDGMTWTQSNITSRNYASIAYANGIFVAGSSGYYAGLLYSTDGMEWKATNNTACAPHDIKYMNDIWIAGTYARDSTLYSIDGIEWKQTNIANIAFTYLESISNNEAYYNTYVAIVKENNTIIDGILFEEPGIYFMHVSSGNSSGYISSFEYEFIKNIDNNYIDDNVFVATYGLTTYDEVREAKDAGKVCVCNLNYSRYTVVATLIEYTASYMRFNYLNGSSQNVGVFIYSGTNKWTISTWNLEKVSNLVTTINSSSTDTTYPSSKAVYDYVNAAVSDAEIELSTTITSASTNDESPSSKAVYNYVNDVLTQLETMAY